MRKAWNLFLLLLGLMLFTGGSWIIYRVITFAPYSQSEFYPAWLPEGAEVRSPSAVAPGTFKIEVPFEEFQEMDRAGISMLVVPTTDSSNSSIIKIDYWMPRGDGIFYHSRANFPGTLKATDFPALTDRKVTFTGDGFQYDPIGKNYAGGIVGLIIIILSFFSISGFLYSRWSRRTRRTGIDQTII